MKKSCSTCGRIHLYGEPCPRRPKRTAQNTHQAAVRSRSRWNRVRAEARLRDGNLCRWCLARGRMETDCLQVHHIIPLAEDADEVYAYSLDHVITLCSRGGASCHALADAGCIPRADLLRLAKSCPQLPQPGGQGQ